MSEELLHEETHTEENAMTMADLEEHFDDLARNLYLCIFYA